MKKIAAFLGAVGLVLTSLASFVASADFTDVTQDDFYYDSVTFLEGEGVVAGYGDGSFGYSLPINRAELLTIVIKAIDPSKLPDSVQWTAYAGENCFADVPANQWYTQYICYAKAEGWVAGYPDNTFKPSQPVNFVEVLKIAMGGLEVEYQTGTAPWYKGVVDSASEKNLIPLTTGSFGQEITRGEMCDIIARILKYEDGGLSEWLGEIAGYVVTYEMLESGDSFFVDGLDSPGSIAEKLSSGGIALSSCGGYKCFKELFSTCETGSVEVQNLATALLGIVFGYEIQGMDGDFCAVKFNVHSLSSDYASDMVCALNNSADFDVQVEGLSESGYSGACEGDLVDQIEAPEHDYSGFEVLSNEVYEEAEGDGYYLVVEMADIELDEGDEYTVSCGEGLSVSSAESPIELHGFASGETYSCSVVLGSIFHMHSSSFFFDTPGESCEYEGVTYEHGDSVHTGDCTVCVCVDGGLEECTGECE